MAADNLERVDEFWDLFEFEFDYPQSVAENGVPENTLYSYISNTYLAGFINYVDPIKAVMINRYRTDGYNHEEESTKINVRVHTDINTLQDDVLVAAQTENDYWFFWFDRDSSDCVIGRFNKSRCTKDKYISLFDKLTKKHGYFGGGTWEINMTGWISG